MGKPRSPAWPRPPLIFPQTPTPQSGPKTPPLPEHTRSFPPQDLCTGRSLTEGYSCTFPRPPLTHSFHPSTPRLPGHAGKGTLCAPWAHVQASSPHSALTETLPGPRPLGQLPAGGPLVVTLLSCLRPACLVLRCVQRAGVRNCQEHWHAWLPGRNQTAAQEPLSPTVIPGACRFPGFPAAPLAPYSAWHREDTHPSMGQRFSATRKLSLLAPAAPHPRSFSAPFPPCIQPGPPPAGRGDERAVPSTEPRKPAPDGKPL